MRIDGIFKSRKVRRQIRYHEVTPCKGLWEEDNIVRTSTFYWRPRNQTEQLVELRKYEESGRPPTNPPDGWDERRLRLAETLRSVTYVRVCYELDGEDDWVRQSFQEERLAEKFITYLMNEAAGLLFDRKIFTVHSTTRVLKEGDELLVQRDRVTYFHGLGEFEE